MLFFVSAAVFAADVLNVDLKKDSCYLLLLDDEAVDFSVSNPNIIRFQLVNTLIDDKQELILQTLNPGVTTFDVKTKTSLHKYKFSILDNANPLCENIFEIEKPKEGQGK